MGTIGWSEGCQPHGGVAAATQDWMAASISTGRCFPRERSGTPARSSSSSSSSSSFPPVWSRSLAHAFNPLLLSSARCASPMPTARGHRCTRAHNTTDWADGRPRLSLHLLHELAAASTPARASSAGTCAVRPHLLRELAAARVDIVHHLQQRLPLDLLLPHMRRRVCRHISGGCHAPVGARQQGRAGCHAGGPAAPQPLLQQLGSQGHTRARHDQALQLGTTASAVAATASMRWESRRQRRAPVKSKEKAQRCSLRTNSACFSCCGTSRSSGSGSAAIAGGVSRQVSERRGAAACQGARPAAGSSSCR